MEIIMQDQPAQQPASKSKKQLIWGLVCLLGPTTLIVVSILLYAIMNFIFGSIASSDVAYSDSPVKVVLNVVLFLVGIVSVVTWLPGLIGGIILLATRKK